VRSRSTEIIIFREISEKKNDTLRRREKERKRERERE